MAALRAAYSDVDHLPQDCCRNILLTHRQTQFSILSRHSLYKYRDEYSAERPVPISPKHHATPAESPLADESVPAAQNPVVVHAHINHVLCRLLPPGVNLGTLNKLCSCGWRGISGIFFIHPQIVLLAAKTP